MSRGRFITLEGGEGCGKSTQVERLKRNLENHGISVVLTREPGGTRLAEQIRALLKDEEEDPPCDRSELLLFLAARAQLVKNVILPSLNEGKWVISDRFSDSTFAYQGYGRGLPLDFLRMANDFACENLQPDLTVLLDVPPEVSALRLRVRENENNSHSDRIERAGDSFHLRLRAGFLEMARSQPNRFVTIDASPARDEVEEEIWKSLKRFL